MTQPDMTFKHMTTGELLPGCFCPDSLEEERLSHCAWTV